MANPTTNYGFIMPENSDLVKDLPADFDIFGQAVDTKIKDLNPETTAGDISYRGSTANAKTRLAIGTAGQYLAVNSGATAPEWITPPAAGGMTLLSTTTLSGATTTISTISQSYKMLKILVIDVVSSNQSEIAGFRLNGDTGSNYAYEGYPGYSSGAATTLYYGLTTTSSDWDKTHSGEILINRYTETERKYIFFSSYQNAGSYRTQVGVGRFNSTTAISSITFTAGAGTFSSGTVYIYGVN